MPSPKNSEAYKKNQLKKQEKRKRILLEIAEALDIPPAANTGKVSARSLESALVSAWDSGGSDGLRNCLETWLSRLPPFWLGL